MEGECPHFCGGRPLAEQVHKFMDKRPVKTEDEKRLQEALRASIDQIDNDSFPVPEGEDEDSECEEEGEEEEDEEDDDDESPSEFFYADENVTLRTLNERRLQAIIFNVKGFLESMSAAVKRLERSPTTAKRTVQIENLNRIIVEMESVRGQLHVCLYPYDMYENCFIALTDPSKPKQEQEQPMSAEGALTIFTNTVWNSFAALCRRMLQSKKQNTSGRRDGSDDLDFLLDFLEKYSKGMFIPDRALFQTALAVCLRNLNSEYVFTDREIFTCEKILERWAELFSADGKYNGEIDLFKRALDHMKYTLYTPPAHASLPNDILYSDTLFTVHTNKEKSHIAVHVHNRKLFLAKIRQTIKLLKSSPPNAKHSLWIDTLQEVVRNIGNVSELRTGLAYRHVMWRDCFYALTDDFKRNLATDKVKVATVKKDPTDGPSSYLENTLKRRRRAKMTDEQIRERLAETRSSAPSSSVETKQPPPPAQKELPPPLECEICSLSIQPMQDEYYEYTCGPRKPRCFFPCHMSCLREHFKTGKKTVWKEKKCPKEGCSNQMLSLDIVRASLKKDPFITDNKKEAKEPERNQKKANKKGKQQKTNGERPSGGSPRGSTPGTPEPEKEEEEQVTPPEAVATPPSPTGPVSASPSTETLEERMETLRRLEQPAVPMPKKQDQTELKYAVTDAAAPVKSKTKKVKKVIPIELHCTNERGQRRFNPNQNSNNRQKTASFSHDDFPDRIEAKATFPLPGRTGSEDYQRQILEAVSTLIVELPANCPNYREGETECLASLIENLIVMGTAILSDPQVAYLRELLKLPAANGAILYQFVSGLRYFNVGHLHNEWRYQKNEDGVQLERLAVVDQGEEEYPCEICFEEVVVSGDKPLLSCRECSRLFHEVCVRPWLLKYQGTCPHCRAHFLLDDHFPEL